MKYAIAMLATTLGACASMSSPEEMKSQLHEANPILSVLKAAKSSGDSQEPEPQVTLPFRLAVAPPLRNVWTQAERDEIRSWEEPLKKVGVISELIIIPTMQVDTSADESQEATMRRIHDGAAKFGADAVLVAASVTEVDKYLNPLGALYLTGVGAFIFHGNTVDSLTVMEGVLIDNRSGFLYAAADSEGAGSVGRSLVTSGSKEAIRESRLEALKKFGQEFVRQAGRMKPTARGKRYETPK